MQFGIDARHLDATFLGQGTFELTGMASSTAGVASVEVVAMVDRVETDLCAAAIASNGSFAFIDTVGPYMQGFITATETDASRGTASGGASYSLQAGAGAPYVAREDQYTADGNAYTASILFHRGFSSTELGQTVDSGYYTTLDNRYQGDTIFVFDPGYGFEAVQGLKLA